MLEKHVFCITEKGAQKLFPGASIGGLPILAHPSVLEKPLPKEHQTVVNLFVEHLRDRLRIPSVLYYYIDDEYGVYFYIEPFIVDVFWPNPQNHPVGEYISKPCAIFAGRKWLGRNSETLTASNDLSLYVPPDYSALVPSPEQQSFARALSVIRPDANILCAFYEINCIRGYLFTAAIKLQQKKFLLDRRDLRITPDEDARFLLSMFILIFIAVLALLVGSSLK